MWKQIELVVLIALETPRVARMVCLHKVAPVRRCLGIPGSAAAAATPQRGRESATDGAPTAPHNKKIKNNSCEGAYVFGRADL